jgi:hypothetical protein
MADLISRADGNFKTASTWGVAMTATGSFLNSEAANTALTTSYVDGGNITFDGSTQIDALLVSIASRAASPSGTMTVALRQGGTVVSGSDVTFNVSDLPLCTSTAGEATSEGKWVICKLVSALTPAAGTYNLAAKTQNASQVNLWRDATAGNWSRMIRTTTQAAPTDGDRQVVGFEFTTTSTPSTRAVTMDDTGSHTYGDNTPSTALISPAMAICNGGKLTFSTSANTEYKANGCIIVYAGGELDVGVSGTPVPNGTTAKITIIPTAADGDFGLINKNLGKINTFGAVASGTVLKTLLNANAAATNTTITTSDTTNWKTGQRIVVGSSNRGADQSEAFVLGADASGTTVTLSGGLANAHIGTQITYSSIHVAGLTSVQQDRRVDVILLTRNVQISNGSSPGSGFMTYVYSAPTAQTDLEYTEVFNVGVNTAGKRGIEADPTTGNVGIFKFVNSSLHDAKNFGMFLLPANTSGGSITIDAVAYNLATAVGPAFTIGTTTSKPTASDVTVTLVGMKFATGNGFSTLAYAGSYNISFAGCGGSATYGFGYANNANASNTTLGGLTLRFTGGIGGLSIGQLGLRGVISVNATRLSDGANTAISMIQTGIDVIVDPCLISGCGGGPGTSDAGILTLRNGFVCGESGVGNSNFGVWADETEARFYLENMEIGATDATVSNITLAGVINAINLNPDGPQATNAVVVGRNAYIGGTNKIAQRSAYSRWASVANSYGTNQFCELVGGTLSRDTTFVQGGQGSSMRMTPRSSVAKLRSARMLEGFSVPCQASTAVTVTVYTRRSTSGDGGLYNGNPQRLRVVADPMQGISGDSAFDDAHTLATSTNASQGAFEAMTASVTPLVDGVLLFIVDCDGTVGWVNVNWQPTVTGAVSSATLEWNAGLPFLAGSPASGGGGGILANPGLDGGLG